MTKLTAAEHLNRIHRLLYPEDWMTPEVKAKAVEDGKLNQEGVYEWQGPEELEAVGEILFDAWRDGYIQPEERDDWIGVNR